jgi:hypothetical protein
LVAVALGQGERIVLGTFSNEQQSQKTRRRSNP